MVSVVMHFNPDLAHQVRHALAFEAAGVETTPDTAGDADVHIVSGPYFALPRWKGHKNLILIDRAFYGDPEYVQICWLNPDGSRTYAGGDYARYSPQMQPWKAWPAGDLSALVLLDYGQHAPKIVQTKNGLFKMPAISQARWGKIVVRHHPAESGLRSGEMPAVSLASQLADADVCIGHSSTGLFEAVVSGVRVMCSDPSNIVADVSVEPSSCGLWNGDREAWLHRVSYMQWNHSEFGLALNLLLTQRNIEC